MGEGEGTRESWGTERECELVGEVIVELGAAEWAGAGTRG